VTVEIGRDVAVAMLLMNRVRVRVRVRGSVKVRGGISADVKDSVIRLLRL
jgi:hypothetical protein